MIQINCEMKYYERIKQGFKNNPSIKSMKIKSYKYGIWNRIGKRKNKSPFNNHDYQIIFI